MSTFKRTKIICTLGPASNTAEKITELVEAGMNVCRLNFSHGTHEDHAKLIGLIRQVSKQTGEPLCILQDLQGPKIRVGELPEEGVMLVAGKDITFTTGKVEIPTKLPVTYPKLQDDVQVGQRLLLDDGLLSVKVKQISGKDVICEVINGGKLTSHKGLNLPETKTTISAISDKDRDDVRFGIEQGVDWIALSFVREAADIVALREIIKEFETELKIVAEAPIRIIAKIEKPEGVANFDQILAAVDGIMVARGDLGIEVPAEKVPVIQKDIIKKCLLTSKPVVVATQMLDSMIHNPRATRAEISDIANAVIDHADATMLSGETASGAYPVDAVKIMAATIRETEASIYDDLPDTIRHAENAETAMSNIAAVLSSANNPKLILVASMSGNAARLISRYRPEVPIFAATPSERVIRQLNMSWGVRPFHLAKCTTVAELVTQSIVYLQSNGHVAANDEIVIAAGEPLGQSGYINLVEIRRV